MAGGRPWGPHYERLSVAHQPVEWALEQALGVPIAAKEYNQIAPLCQHQAQVKQRIGPRLRREHTRHQDRTHTPTLHPARSGGGWQLSRCQMQSTCRAPGGKAQEVDRAQGMAPGV